MNTEENNAETNGEMSDSDFENLFFNGEPVVEDEPVKQEDAPDEDSGDDEEVDSPATEEDEDDNEPEVDEKPKAKNRKSAQERINELTADKRATQRELEALRREFDAFKAGRGEEKKEEPTLKEKLPVGAPTPDAKDEDGNDLYELGEFDPKFIRDLTKFTVEQEMKEAETARQRAAQEKEFQEVQNAVRENWTNNLDTYVQENEGAREDMVQLVEAFDGLDPNYGEYLATTIMASEYGPHVMHYLSQNIGEAQKIVASGPAAATLALGRLEARFMKSTKEENTGNKRKVSDAPEPPEERTRGIKGQFAVRPDTDDQRAFEREFFKK